MKCRFLPVASFACVAGLIIGIVFCFVESSGAGVTKKPVDANGNVVVVQKRSGASPS